MQTKPSGGFVVTVFISIALNADSVAPKVSIEPSFVC